MMVLEKNQTVAGIKGIRRAPRFSRVVPFYNLSAQKQPSKTIIGEEK